MDANKFLTCFKKYVSSCVLETVPFYNFSIFNNQNFVIISSSLLVCTFFNLVYIKYKLVTVNNINRNVVRQTEESFQSATLKKSPNSISNTSVGNVKNNVINVMVCSIIIYL